MSDPKDKKSDRQPEDPAPADPPAEGKRSGRVAFDARGNPIWEWQLETGVYSRDVSTQKLKKLDLGDLSIADTGIMQQPTGLGGDKPAAPGGGFNPYDNSSRPSTTNTNPYDNARATSRRMAEKTPVESKSPVRTPADMRKLDEWIKLRKNLKNDPGSEK